MIRVLHVTEDHSINNTGISAAVDALTRCVPQEIQPSIICVGTDTVPVKEGVHLIALPLSGPGKLWRLASSSNQMLQQAVEEADVVHLHGLWMWVQWAAAHMALRCHKPFVVTPHGMLEPWIWQRQSWPNQLKKYIYWNGIAHPVFRKAILVHALTLREEGNLKFYFQKNRTAVIPTGIDLQSTRQILATLPPADLQLSPYFLFLGRLHPVKGIHNLIRAFARLTNSHFRLVIAGPTQPKEVVYAESLHKLVAELGIGERVAFTGAVRGVEKWQLYRDAWSFCLPSFSEAFPMVNLEAAAASTPVITTFGTGIEDDWEHNGGIQVQPSEQSIYSALEQAASWELEERQSRGMATRSLVERYFSWEKIGRDWVNGYDRLLGG